MKWMRFKSKCEEGGDAGVERVGKVLRREGGSSAVDYIFGMGPFRISSYGNGKVE